MTCAARTTDSSCPEWSKKELDSATSWDPCPSHMASTGPSRKDKLMPSPPIAQWTRWPSTWTTGPSAALTRPHEPASQARVAWMTGAKPNRSLPIWERQDFPPSSAKNQNVQFENCEILNCVSWERFPRPFNVKRA